LSSQIKARLVASVKDNQDVSLVIEFARKNNLPLAIKGGGHSTAGSSSSEGVVIDLSRYVNTVEVMLIRWRMLEVEPSGRHLGDC